jgi:uncharacterized protein YfiM (DUF2279 family)
LDRCQNLSCKNPPSTGRSDKSKRASCLQEQLATHSSRFVSDSTTKLTVKHFVAAAALPCANNQKVAVNRLKQKVKPHSTNMRQMFSLNVPNAKTKDKTAIARRKKPNEAANIGSSSPADGLVSLNCVE